MAASEDVKPLSAVEKRTGGTFRERLDRLYLDWKANRDGDWQHADAFILVCGKSSNSITYKKTSAMTVWLWGVENVNNTILLFTEKEFIVVTNADKAARLKRICTVVPFGEGVPVRFVERESNHEEEADKTLMAQLLEDVGQSFEGKKIGIVEQTFRRETGPIVDRAKEACEKSALETVEVGRALALVFACKDESEAKLLRTASSVTQVVMKNFFVPKLEKLIKGDTSSTHAKLSQAMDELLDDPKKISSKLSEKTVDACYSPIVQSGGKYDLRPAAVSDDRKLSYDTILLSVGTRYKCYCSNVARTLFVNPTDIQKKAYQAALEVREAVFKALSPGTKISAVYQAAEEVISSKYEEFKGKLYTDLGFGIGPEFRERVLLIKEGNHTEIREKMSFNVAIGMNHFDNPEATTEEGKTFAILISDTVSVGADGGVALTKNAVDWDTIAYSFEKNELSAKDLKAMADTSTSIGEQRRKERQKQIQESVDREESRRAHQRELGERVRARALAILEGREDEYSFTKAEVEKKMVVSYGSGPAAFPREARRGQLYVDMNRESVLLPIYGTHVPMHVSTLKNITKTPELCELRFNFISPTHNISGSTSSGAQKKLSVVEKAVLANPALIYLREITYRCVDIHHLNNILRQVNELRKRIRDRENLRKQQEGVITQGKLVLSVNRRHNPRLTGVMMRPPPSGGRRVQGSLETHQNGFRYTTSKGETVDLLVDNIRHAFFQPPKKSLIVLIHFHLKHPIMVGRRKTQDIQFIKEVMEQSNNLVGQRSSNWDVDETAEEEHERAMRRRLRSEFQSFAKQSSDKLDLEFDVPYYELSFTGVPQRNNVLLLPSSHCLVHLEEPPFFVLSLEDVQICSFERVDFNLRLFDMVFIMHDLTKAPVTINSVMSKRLENIKAWLDACDIKYYETPRSLNWSRIMQMIRKDPQGFWDDGGWDELLLTGDGADESSESEDDAPRSSDYEPTSSDEDESDYSDEYEESDDESEDESSEESSEGEDWDALDRKARQEDAKKSF